ncbi:MAG TPA: type III pantothenate kinase [Prolixibacteraceae bacterium]|nr:type III pantothenate kinase [Prolixibacteraceae bacterium]
MNLIIDIGNSLTKVYLFDEGRAVESFVIDKTIIPFIQQLLIDYKSIKRAIISSTRDYDPEISGLLDKLPDGWSELTSETELPIANKYKTPETLGKDRLAAVVGAQTLFPGRNVLVIDAGTAITYDIINELGEYYGGSISPGLLMRFRALHQFTGRLPLLMPRDRFEFPGNSTEEAIISGVEQGILFEIEAYIAHFKKNYKNLEVIFTGGDSNFFDSKLKNSFFVCSNLVAFGLNRILDHNAKKY